MVSQSQARRETNFEETEIVKDKNVSRGMVELWKDLVNRRKGTQGKKVDLILYPKTGLRKKAPSRPIGTSALQNGTSAQLKLNY